MEKVTGHKISCLIALNLIGSFIVLGSSEAEQDSWIAMTAAIVLSLLLAWLYSAILRLHPGENMFSIFTEVLGNTGGKIVSGLYAGYAIFLGARIVAIYINFIQIVNLDNTPLAALLLLSMPMEAWFVKGGLKSMGDCAKFLYTFTVVLALASLLLGLRYMDVNNIKPILATAPETMLRVTGGYLMLPLGETVLCMSCFGEVDRKESPFRILSVGTLLGGVIVLTGILGNSLLLSAPVCRLFLFTTYQAIGIVSVGDFITRISVIIGVEMTLTGFAKVGCFAYSASLGTSKVLGLKEYRGLVPSCCLLMAALSLIFFRDILTAINFKTNIAEIGVPFQVVIPLIVLVVGKIRQTGGKKKKAAVKKTAAVQSRVSEE